MVVVRSTTTAILIAGGIEAARRGSRARTRSTVSIMLASGWRNRMIRTAGLPFARPALRRSCTAVDHRGDVAAAARRCRSGN